MGFWNKLERIIMRFARKSSGNRQNQEDTPTEQVKTEEPPKEVEELNQKQEESKEKTPQKDIPPYIQELGVAGIMVFEMYEASRGFPPTNPYLWTVPDGKDLPLDDIKVENFEVMLVDSNASVKDWKKITNKEWEFTVAGADEKTTRTYTIIFNTD